MALSPDQREITASEDVFRISTVGKKEAQAAAASRWMAVCQEMGWTSHLPKLLTPPDAEVDAHMGELLGLGIDLHDIDV